MADKPDKPRKIHVKPTLEEREEGIKKSLGEIEVLEDNPASPSQEIPPAEEPAPSEPAPEENPSPSAPPAPSEPAPEETPEEEVDYKKKFIASSREAQILHAKNKKINEALEKATGVAEPTDEEMLGEYPDWEMMGEFEKKIAKQTYLANKRFSALDEVSRDFRDSQKWEEGVNQFLADPQTLVKYPTLEGREDELRLFAMKPTRRGVDPVDLVSAFLYNVESQKPPMKKGKMFEVGSAGPVAPAKKSNKISIEDARLIRKTDFKKYRELLKAGKIATEEV